jgi:hypothetical protein
MGIKLVDEFTLLHVATGIIAYYWGIGFWLLFALHTVFELAENTETGMKIIRRITIWPGGKSSADSWLNSVGDTLASAAGWLLAWLAAGNL